MEEPKVALVIGISIRDDEPFAIEKREDGFEAVATEQCVSHLLKKVLRDFSF